MGLIMDTAKDMTAVYARSRSHPRSSRYGRVFELVVWWSWSSALLPKDILSRKWLWRQLRLAVCTFYYDPPLKLTNHPPIILEKFVPSRDLTASTASTRNRVASAPQSTTTSRQQKRAKPLTVSTSSKGSQT